MAAVAALVAGASRPAFVVGGDVWFGRAEQALRRAAEALQVPVFMNGMGRGCLPADDPLAFSRVRGLLEAARPTSSSWSARHWTSGSRSATSARPRSCTWPTRPAGSRPTGRWPGRRAATWPRSSTGWPPGAATGSAHEPWLDRLRAAEDAVRAKDEQLLAGDGPVIRPPAVYGALRSRLERDAVVIGDGGDFVSYAGKFVDSYQPGCWLDPGPYGCLGTGLGYAIAARVARPSSQVVLLLGDGAAGFSLMDVDTLVRHDLPVVMIVGNNGGWGLEKHPMRAIYGYDVAAELRPETRYDEVVAGARRRGGDRAVAGRARSGAGPGVRLRGALPGQRADRPGRQLPPVVGAGLSGAEAVAVDDGPGYPAGGHRAAVLGELSPRT